MIEFYFPFRQQQQHQPVIAASNFPSIHKFSCMIFHQKITILFHPLYAFIIIIGQLRDVMVL